MNAPGRMSFASALAAALSTVKETALEGAQRFTELLAGARRFQNQYTQLLYKRRRGHSAKSPSANRRPGPPRRGRARGPGSINARADGLYLARIGKFKEAAEMLDQQFPELAARYRRFDNFVGHPEYEQQIAVIDYDPTRFVP